MPDDFETPEEEALRVSKKLNVKSTPTQPYEQGFIPSYPITETAEVKTSNWQDTFRNYIAPLLQGLFVSGGRIGGGALGTTAAGPGLGTALGAAGGGLAGNTLYGTLQASSPRTFGAPPETMGEAFGEGLYNTGLDYLGGKAGGYLANKLAPVIGMAGAVTPSGRVALKSKIYNKFFPIDPLRQDIAESMLTPEGMALEPDIAQLSQSPTARVLRDIGLRKETEKKFAFQQKQLTQQARGLLEDVSSGGYKEITDLDQPVAKVARAKAFAKSENLRNARNTLFKTAEENIIPNEKGFVKRVDPKTKEEIVESIRGPIVLEKSVGLADDILRSIQHTLDDPVTARVISTQKDVAEYLISLRRLANQFKSAVLRSTDDKPVLDYFAAKEMKEGFNRQSSNELVNERLEGAVKGFRNALAGDMQASFNTWSAPAKDAIKRAYAANENYLRLYDNTLVSDLVKSGIQDPGLIEEEVLKKAFSSYGQAEKFVEAVGSRSEAGGVFLRNIMKKSQNTEGLWDGTKFLEGLSDDASRAVLTADQRSALTQLGRRMQAVDPNFANAGWVAANIRYGSAIFALTSGALTAMGTGSLPTGAKTGGLIYLTVKAGRPIVKNLLMNPQNTRLYAKLVGQPAGAPGSSNTIKKLLRTAFKGAQFYIQYQQEGPPVAQGTINQQGQLEVTPVPLTKDDFQE